MVDKIAELLGVRVGQTFKVGNTSYKLWEDGLHYQVGDNHWCRCSSNILEELLLGKLQIAMDIECGDCVHWKPIDERETYNDLLGEFYLFGKVIGDCGKCLGMPMFNYEKCKFYK